MADRYWYRAGYVGVEGGRTIFPVHYIRAVGMEQVWQESPQWPSVVDSLRDSRDLDLVKRAFPDFPHG